MCYESGNSVPIDDIAGVEYDSEPEDEIMIMLNISVATSESAEDPRKNTISNISVPQASGTRLKVQPGGDALPELTDFDTSGAGRPTRMRTKPTRMNISSNKGSTHGIALVQAIYMTQITEL